MIGCDGSDSFALKSVPAPILCVLLNVMSWFIDCEILDFCNYTFMLLIVQAQKAEREASDLKGTMRKRMEFLDLD